MASGSADADGTWPDGPAGRPPHGHGDGREGIGSGDSTTGTGPADGWPGWSLPLPPGLTVPDDAGELEGDRRQWMREQRRQRVRRRLLTGPPGPAHPTLLLLLLIAVLISGLSTVSVLLVPRPSRSQLPLAVTSARAGAVGGLLPDVSLEGPVRTVAARSIRPTVLLVLPAAGCACEGLVREAVRSAGGVGIVPWLVVGDRSAHAAELSRTARRSGGLTAVDSAGAIAQALDATGPMLVLVHADGVIGQAHAVTAAEAADIEPVRRWLDAQLPALHRAGAAVTASTAG